MQPPFRFIYVHWSLFWKQWIKYQHAYLNWCFWNWELCRRWKLIPWVAEITQTGRISNVHLWTLWMPRERCKHLDTARLIEEAGYLLHSMTENKILIYLHDTYCWRSLSSVICYKGGVVFRFVRNHVMDLTRTDFHSHWIQYSYQRHFMLISTIFPMFWLWWWPLQLELPFHNYQ